MADSFDAAFEATWAEINPTAVDESPAADTTAIEAAVPDDVSAPDEDVDQIDAESEDEEVAAAPEPATPNWDDENNPYRRQAQEAEQQRQNALRVIAQAEQVRQRNERNQRIQQAVSELPNLDPDQLNAAVQRIIAEAATPFAQDAQQARAEVEQLAKVKTVDVIAQRFGLTPEDAQVLQQFNHPLQMEQYAASIQAGRSAQQAELADVRAKLALYEKQEKARKRNPNADIAGGSNGGAPSTSSKPTSSDPFDQYWAQNDMDQAFTRAR